MSDTRMRGRQTAPRLMLAATLTAGSGSGGCSQTISGSRSNDVYVTSGTVCLSGAQIWANVIVSSGANAVITSR